MEEAGCQEANEDEQKHSCLFQSFIASPQGGSFRPSHYWHHLKSLAVFFLDLWRVCWFRSESIGGSRVMEFLPHFCFIPAKSPQGVKKKKKVFVGLWSQELLGTSWTWLCPVDFFPSSTSCYILASIISGSSSDSKIFGGLCSFHTLNRTKLTSIAERKHFYRLSKSLHCWEELKKKVETFLSSLYF